MSPKAARKPMELKCTLAALQAGLPLPCSIQQIERLILETAAYSKQRNGAPHLLSPGHTTADG